MIPAPAQILALVAAAAANGGISASEIGRRLGTTSDTVLRHIRAAGCISVGTGAQRRWYPPPDTPVPPPPPSATPIADEIQRQVLLEVMVFVRQELERMRPRLQEAADAAVARADLTEIVARAIADHLRGAIISIQLPATPSPGRCT